VNCQDARQAIDAQVIGALGRDEVAALDVHLTTCVDCAQLMADARRLQAELRLIGTEGPSPQSWDRIAAQLTADPAFQRAAPATPEHDARSRGLAWRWLAMAAMLVLIVAGSLLVLRHSLGTTPADTGMARSSGDSPADLVTSIEGELDLAARHYENAIAGLERIANESESPLDPAMMATLRRSLAVIDSAIDESRQALRTDPQSQLAQQSLFDAFRRKVALLQDTIALMNEMRKGNPAGATAIASGLNKG